MESFSKLDFQETWDVEENWKDDDGEKIGSDSPSSHPAEKNNASHIVLLKIANKEEPDSG